MAIYLIVGILIGAGVLYLCLRKKLISVQIDNTELIENQKRLIDQEQRLKESVREQQIQSNEVKDRLELLRWAENKEQEHLQKLQDEAKKLGDNYYEAEIEKAKAKIDGETRALEQDLAQAKKDCESAYLEVLQDSLAQYLNKDTELKAKLEQEKIEAQEIKEAIQDLVAKMAAAVEVNKRLELDRTAKDFYQLQLSEADRDEIGRLRQVSNFLRDKEPLNKVIYKTYYEKPYNALVGRVIGSQKKCGIYKITNIDNGMCYIGQSVDVAERWRQHIKRAVGAETVTRNKLYPAMFSLGPENFTFELVEECDSAKLNEREKYWIDYCKSKEFGYNSTSGGA